MALKSVTIRDEGDKVTLIIDGTGHTLPYQQAFELARAIYVKAQKAEEFAQANRIIADGALLTRLGVPVGLTNNPKLKDEIRKEAAWNGELRRYLPGGVKSKSVVGTPAVRRAAPQMIRPGGIKTGAEFGRIGG
jgi:hypothetical protein